MHAPLLLRDDEQQQRSGMADSGGAGSTSTPTTISPTSPTSESSASMHHYVPLSHMMSPTSRRIVQRCLSIPTAADALPQVVHIIATSGKNSFVSLLLAYIAFCAIWLPFWALAFLTTEWGIYALFVGTVFFVGRIIIRYVVPFIHCCERTRNHRWIDRHHYCGAETLNLILILSIFLSSNPDSSFVPSFFLLQTPRLPRIFPARVWRN